MPKQDIEVIKSLKTFKDLSANKSTHSALIKEKKIILYTATLLESDNSDVLTLCLDILENFAANEEAHEFLVSTFGIYEALENLSIRIRKKYEDIYSRSVYITDLLRNCTPPAYNTRNRVKTSKSFKKHQLYLLFIEDLNTDNQAKLERVLLKIRGVISFLVDTELRRCTVRICPRLRIKEVIEKIYMKCDLKAVIVTKNMQAGTEAFCDILEKEANNSYLEYPDEANSTSARAVSAVFHNISRNGNSILKSMVSLWNDSFYW